MSDLNTTSLLASFATIKSLCDEKKYNGPYEILREFIRNCLYLESMGFASVYDVGELLNKHFGFVLPIAVVKSAMKNMPEVSLSRGQYTIQFDRFKYDKEFDTKERAAQEECDNVVHELMEFIRSNSGKSEVITKEKVTQELINYVLDNPAEQGNRYSDYILAFIATKKDDMGVQKALNNILGGSILYLGLSQNVVETGSIISPIKLYLNTEILFHFVGLNGEIFKNLALDFFNLVKTANEKKTMITLLYFSDVKREIEDFFYAAESIVEGKRILPEGKPAMKAIVNGCETVADVKVKLTDFFYKCEKLYGIREENNVSYYEREDFSLNLESFVNDERDEEKKRKKEMAQKLISNINKLRKGKRAATELESGHLIVTNSSTILEMSRQEVEEENQGVDGNSSCGYAISLNRVTNILWYKLGGFFAQKGLPYNVNAVISAKTALSSSIGYRITKVFKEAVKEFNAGTTSKELLAARILALRDKPVLPEELDGIDAVDALDFSPDYLERYEGAISGQKAERERREELEKIVENLEIEKQEAIREQTLREEKDIRVANELKRLREEVENYRSIENYKLEKKKRRKRIFTKIVGLLVLMIVGAVIILGVWCVCKKTDFPTLISVIGGLITIGAVLVPVFKWVWRKFFQEDGTID